MTKTPKRPRDPNELARRIVDIATGEVADESPPDSNRAKAAQLGGKARGEALSPEQRTAIATAAAKKRWDSHG